MSGDATVRLRAGRSTEAAALSALALRSKSHWGYSADFLAACREELTYTPDQCSSGAMVVAERQGRILGFYLFAGAPPDAELLALFVDTDVIGCGLGARLLRHALATVTDLGFRTLTLAADPGAESFYTRYGAELIGHTPSGSIPGRTLPSLRFDLDRGP